MRTPLCAIVALSLVVPGAALDGDTGSADPAPRSGTWKRLRGTAFEVVGNASAYDLRRTAREMERFRQALRVMFPGVRTEGPSPTRVVVFRDDNAMTPFKPRRDGKRQDNVAGYFTSRPDANYLVLAPHGGEFTYHVIFHEFTHHVIRLNIPRAPLWLHEGLAEFYGTFAGSERDNRSVVGRPLPHHLAMLHNHPMIPLQVLLSPDVRKVAFRTRVSTGVFYAESWALIHYLLLGEESRHRRGLQQLLARQHSARGVSEDEFRSAFGMSFAGMEAAVKAHISRMQIPALQLLDPPDVAAAPEPEPLLEVEAQQVQGDLLVKLGQAAAAEKFLQKALAIDSRDFPTRLSLAQCRMIDGRFAEAVDIVEPVARELSGSFAAQWVHGEALRMAGQSAGAIQAYERAVAINAHEPSSYFGAAVAQMAAGQPQADETFAALLRLDPDPGWHFARMYEAWLAGRNDLALADGLAYLEQSSWESDQSTYAALAVALEQMRRGRQDDAAAALAAAAEHVEKKSWLADLVGFLQGRLTAAKLLDRADSNEMLTEAHAYVGVKASVEGRLDEAMTHLTWVEKQGNRAFVEHKLARGELKRLREGAPTAAQVDAK